MSLLIKTHLKLARISIKENRTRSFLTCLGIAIGVASIILILSLMGSISRLISDQVKNIGADLIVVRPASNKDAMTGIIPLLFVCWIIFWSRFLSYIHQRTIGKPLGI